jgi:nickel transport protein
MSRAPLLGLIGSAALLLAPAELFAPGAARAHGIQSTLERLGSLSSALDAGGNASGPRATDPRLQLETEFSSGVPASEAAVRLVPPDGGPPIELGRTDARGRLTFSLPAQARKDWEIQVDAGPGHRDYLELPPADRASGVDHAALPLPSMALALGWAPLALLGLLGGVGGLLQSRRRS